MTVIVMLRWNHSATVQLGGNFLYEPEDMMGGDMVDEGGGERGGGEREGGECLRCKLSPPAQSTLRRIFDGIVSDCLWFVQTLTMCGSSFFSFC